MSEPSRRPWVAALGLALLAPWLPGGSVRAQPAWDEGVFRETAPEQTSGDEPIPFEADAADGGDAASESDEAFEETVIEPELLAGLGLGTRSLRFPTQSGPATTDTGPYLAIELGVSLGFRRKPTRKFGLRAHYVTSAGLDVEEQRVAALPRTYSARSHQIRGGLFMTFSLGDRVTLDTALAYEARNFHSIVPDVQTPSFTLSGPLLSLGIEVSIAEGRAWLGLGPELSGILQVGQQAREDGADRVGIEGGGEALIGVRVWRSLGCEAVYYESRARVGGGESGLRDGIRLVTLRLRGAL